MHELREIDELIASPRGEQSAGDDHECDRRVSLEAIGEFTDARVAHRRAGDQARGERSNALQERQCRVEGGPEDEEERAEEDEKKHGQTVSGAVSTHGPSEFRISNFE